MTRPRLLDLFCGAGGAAMGYDRAGFDVVGVDCCEQPNYPFRYIRDDAMGFLDFDEGEWWQTFDAIHASPPCQAYSTATADHSKHPDLYAEVRDLLAASGLPWVIENVIGAPYRQGVVLCGSMFGLRVRRHRNFESSFLMMPPVCDHRSQGTPLGVYGHGGGERFPRPKGGSRGVKAEQKDFPALLEMPWATPQEAVQAVPPAYTQWIGGQLLAHLEVAA